MRVLMWLRLVNRASAGYAADRLTNALRQSLLASGIEPFLLREDFISENRRSSGKSILLSIKVI